MPPKKKLKRMNTDDAIKRFCNNNNIPRPHSASLLESEIIKLGTRHSNVVQGMTRDYLNNSSEEADQIRRCVNEGGVRATAEERVLAKMEGPSFFTTLYHEGPEMTPTLAAKGDSLCNRVASAM